MWSKSEQLRLTEALRLYGLDYDKVKRSNFINYDRVTKHVGTRSRIEC